MRAGKFSDEVTASKLIAFGASVQSGSPSGLDILLNNGEKAIARRLAAQPLGHGGGAGSGGGGGFRGSALSFLQALELKTTEAASAPLAQSTNGGGSGGSEDAPTRSTSRFKYMIKTRDTDIKEIEYVSGGAFTNLCL